MFRRFIENLYIFWTIGEAGMR